MTDTSESTSSYLLLKGRGSFFVGGHRVQQSFVDLGSRRPADTVTVDQMYVEYMVPSHVTAAPIVLIHGAGQSGNSYDTTPDGRMGWFEYFVRQGRATYVVDQVGRGRSGFNQAIFNRVAEGDVPASSQPRIARIGDDIGAWVNFRIGPNPQQAFEDSQFPIEAIDAASQRGIPDLNAALPSPNPTYQALVSLARQLEGVVLLGHSQSGAFPLEAALRDNSNILASIIVEPGGCNGSGWTDEQIKTLAEVPTLILYGDHLSNPTGLPGAGWQERMDDCRIFVERLRSEGGSAELWYGPDRGVHGNSHMMMWDKNNLEIAQAIVNWLSSVLR